MIDLADIEALAASVKGYLAERKKYEKLSNRSWDAMTLKQREKHGNDLNWLACDLIKRQAQIHCDAVNAGVAEPRSVERYATTTLHPSAWHKWSWTPPKPRGVE